MSTDQGSPAVAIARAHGGMEQPQAKAVPPCFEV